MTRRTAAVLVAVAVVSLAVGAVGQRLLFDDPADTPPAAATVTGASGAADATPQRPGKAPAGVPDAADRTAIPLPPGSPAPLRPLRAVSTEKRAVADDDATDDNASPGASSAVVSAENEVVRLTNAERARNGCSPLRTDERLRAAARGHSTDMATKGYFSHTAPNGSTFVDRARAAGYNSPGAENIARGQPTAAAVVRSWMNSEGHRANILNCSLRAIGVGVRFGAGGPWWTQVFGRV